MTEPEQEEEKKGKIGRKRAGRQKDSERGRESEQANE